MNVINQLNSKRWLSDDGQKVSNEIY